MELEDVGIGVRLAALLLLGLITAAPHDVAAQFDSSRGYVQVGLGVLPGVGLQGGYVGPKAFYTVEGIAYVDGSPPFAGGEGSVQISGGLGGSIRLFGIMRVLGSPDYSGRDVDIGLRFGPSLFFSLGESSRDKNPFSLFVDPFVRLTSRLDDSRVFFIEAGTQRPILRGGLWLSL